MHKIVLASSSPRRIELLTQAGLELTVMAPDADETMLAGEKPRAMVARLAREKAETVAAHILAKGASTGEKGRNVIVIAADTTVVAPDGKRVLGKPDNEAEARRMLARLAGNTHTVFTGYCILQIRPSHILVRTVRSRVRMRALSRRDIAAYVRTGEPMDKAGAYAAQGIGMALIEEIEGSYSNVVGLPICQVMADLELKFRVPWLTQAGSKRGRR
ncbi:Maf family protein [Bdellovibrionota bacterium FG-1]